jgi:hypothetical protein
LAPHFLLKFSWCKPRYGLLQIKLKTPRRLRSKADEQAVIDAEEIAKANPMIDIVA